MKIIKWNRIILILLFILIVTSCSTNLSNNNYNNKEICIPEENIINYLSKNHSVLDIEDNNDFSSFDMLEPYVNNYQIYLAGEQHSVGVNYDLFFKFIKFFKVKANIKYILIEDSYGISYLLNKYIETGNEDILEKVFSYYYGYSVLWTKEIHEFWIKFRKYNNSLTDEDKMIILGIDVANAEGSNIDVLNQIIPDKDIPEKIKLYINNIKSLNNKIIHNVYYDHIKMLREIYNSISLYKDIYQKYWNENFFDFEFLMKGIIDSLNLNGLTIFTRAIKRDEIMYENFLRLYNRFPQGKYFGQTGFFHVVALKSDLINTLAHRLNKQESTPVKNKVLSIIYRYKNSRALSVNSAEKKYSDYDVNNSPELFDSFTQSNASVLFNLIGKDSPFKHGEYTDVVKTKDYPTSELFQFMVIVSDSEAMKPLKDKK